MWTLYIDGVWGKEGLGCMANNNKTRRRRSHLCTSFWFQNLQQCGLIRSHVGSSKVSNQDGSGESNSPNKLKACSKSSQQRIRKERQENGEICKVRQNTNEYALKFLDQSDTPMRLQEGRRLQQAGINMFRPSIQESVSRDAKREKHWWTSCKHSLTRTTNVDETIHELPL